MYIFLSGLVFLATNEGQPNNMTRENQHAWITTYMDSGYRTLKISPVNPASTSSTRRQAVTVMVKGQYQAFPAPEPPR